MADPWAIVLVPAEGDPGGLLAARRLRLPGPQAAVSVTRAAVPPQVSGWDPSSSLWPSGLPLWWDGALVPAGWDRARRAAYALHPAWMLPTTMEPDQNQLLMVARFLMKTSGARVVLLDLVDGRLVERGPSGPEPQER